MNTTLVPNTVIHVDFTELSHKPQQARTLHDQALSQDNRLVAHSVILTGVSIRTQLLSLAVLTHQRGRTQAGIGVSAILTNSAILTRLVHTLVNVSFTLSAYLKKNKNNTN